MNITPEFRTSKEWKKFKRALGHPAAMEFYVNIACELEGITRKAKCDTGHLGTDDSEDLLLIAGADEYEEVEAAQLEAALLHSGIMSKDEKGYRVLVWELDNANLIRCRQNGRRGGRKKNITETNPTEATQPNETQSNETELNRTKQNKTELNGTELNGTGGLTQQEPRVNPGLAWDNKVKVINSIDLNDREPAELDTEVPF